MKLHKVLAFALLSLAAGYACAQAPAYGADSVVKTIMSAMDPAIKKLTSQAVVWLGGFACLQFLMTNYALIKNGGDLQSAAAKLTGSIAWVAVCVYIIKNGPAFIGGVGEEMFGLLGLSMPSPGSIMASTLGLVGGLAAGAVAIGLPSATAGQLLLYVLLFILAVGTFFAVKILMLHLELGLVVMLAPLSFSFLGLNALKDQGIAPFKALISLTYRIILLSVILSAFTEVNTVMSNAITDIKWSWDAILMAAGGMGSIVEILLSGVGAYVMLAYLVFKSDAIAAGLAGGGTSMGTGDVAGAAAAGAAAGALIGSAGAAGGGALGKAPQAMSEFMSSLRGGGSMSNASPTGSGGGGAPTPTSAAPLSSMPSAPTAGSGASSPSNETPFDGSTKTLPADSPSVATPSVGPNLDASNPTPPSAPESGRSGGTGNGSGANAGVAGGLEDKLDKLVDTLQNSQQPQKPTVGQRLGDTNRHISQESATTHVSINTNHHD